MAKVLMISADELLGIKDIKQHFDPQHEALWSRLKKIDILPKRDQKALLHYLDVLLSKSGYGCEKVRK